MIRIVLATVGAFALGAAVLAPHGASSTAALARGNDGKSLYAVNCATCHQANGNGLPGAFPPLAHNGFVTGNPARVIKTVLHGMNASIEVNGKKYSGQMPAWKGLLSEAQLAAVITYIRTSWGNKASAVTAKQIK